MTQVYVWVSRKVRAALDKAGFPANAVNLAVVSADRAYFRDDRKASGPSPTEPELRQRGRC